MSIRNNVTTSGLLAEVDESVVDLVESLNPTFHAMILEKK